MKNLFFILLAIFFFTSSQSNSATITSNNVSVPRFGTVASDTSSTTTIASSTCTGTAGIVSGCTSGTGTVVTANIATGGGTNTNKRSFRIFITPTITNPTTLIRTNDVTSFTVTGTSPGASNCTSATSGGSTRLSCTNSATSPATWNITINGTLNLLAAQSSALTTKTYTINACACCAASANPTGCTSLNVGCPTTYSASDTRCTTLGKVSTGNLGMSATVYKGISFTENTQLNFGAIAIPATGIVTVNQAGTILSGGGTQVSSLTQFSSGTSPSAGQFTVSGNPSTNYTFTLQSPASSITLACDTGTTTSCTGAPAMQFTALTFASGTASRTLNGSGSDVVTINGILQINSGQLRGNYKGTYTVTVNY